MDFRIRPIRNHDAPFKQQDTVTSTLRELADIMRLSHQYFVNTQKQREQTSGVLLQIKEFLIQKEKTMETIVQEVKKISQKTISTLSKFDLIIQRDNLKINQLNKPESRNKYLDQSINTQNYEENYSSGGEIIKKIEQITITPIESRNVEIRLKSSIKQKSQEQKRKKHIQYYIANLSSKVFSASFNMFFREKIDFEKIKAHCSENMLANIVETVMDAGISVNQIELIDKHLSNMVLPYLKLSYPHSEEKQTSSKLASLIAQKDIFNENRFDVLFNSPVKKMTWHGLKNYDKNDTDNKTSKEVMNLLNYIIELPNKQSKNLKKNDENQKTLYDQFQQDMKNCFNIVYHKSFIDFFKNQGWKMFSQGQRNMANVSSVNDLVQIINSKLFQKLDPQRKDQIDKQETQYHQKVKSYTKIKIGRKISPNCQLYSQKEIEKGNLRIKDPSIKRVITKWIEGLFQMFQNPVQYTILRNELLKLDDSSENNNEGLQEKQTLFELMKVQFNSIKQNFQKMKRNMYENFIDIAIKKENKVFLPDFCSQRQAQLGNVCTIMSRATESYIIKYLITLINSLKRVQKNYAVRTRNLAANQSRPLLVNFKLGDLMRCQVSSKENEIITIYRFIVLICDLIPDKFELVRVKNRFNGPNKDILMNIWYQKTIMIQIQLAIKNDSPFLECSDKYSHFIYELRRDILGPISQLTSVWNKFSPKAQFFEKQYKLAQRKSSFKANPGNICLIQNHPFEDKPQPFPLPFWCSNCKLFQINESHLIMCSKCNFRICSLCQNTRQISKRYQTKEVKLTFASMKRGVLYRGIDIQSKVKKIYYSLQFMGRLCIFSFNYLKRNQFAEIQKKYEQRIQQQQNQISFNQFMMKNYILSEKAPSIDIDSLVSEIFLNFWLNSLKVIHKKKITTYSMIFSSNPKVSQQKKREIIEKTLSNQEISKWSGHIERLNIQQNQLQLLDTLSIFKLAKVVNLSKNRLIQIRSLPIIKTVKVILLKQNLLTSVEGFPKLDSLQEINLNQNQLMSLKGFPNLINLKKIFACNNKISRLQLINDLPLLEQLYLDNNQFVQFGDFPILQNLKHLSIMDNQIRILDGFPNLPLLNTLNLNYNKLKSLKKLPLLKSLIKLQVRYNQIDRLEGTPNFQLLQVFNLDDNNIQSFVGLPPLRSLKSFTVQSSKINSLVGMPQLFLLESLNLDYHNLNHLNGLSDLKNIKKLTISNNSLKSLEGFLNLPLLQTLNLDFNQLTSLKDLPQLLNLKILTVTNNLITVFEHMPFLQSLKTLYFDYNKLSTFKGFPMQENLIQLSVTNNLISGFENFPNLSSLHTLNLTQNKIKSMIGLSQLKKLKVLLLFNNQLESLEGMPQLYSLETLFISNNKLSTFKGLPELTNLKKLISENNSIQSLKGMPSLPDLQNLNLSYNNLQTLEDLPQLNELKILEILSNKVKIDEDWARVRFPQLNLINGKFLYLF